MELVAWGLTILVSAFVGSYLAGYLKKKGENLATHEDVAKLVAQMAAVRQATKEIEATISNDVWERQKKWEVKRDALFRTVRELGNVEYALAMLEATFITGLNAQAIGLKVLKTDKEAVELWNSALLSFNRASILATLLCGEDVGSAVEAMRKSMRITSNAFIRYQPSPLPPDTLPSQMNTLIAAIKSELRLSGATPRSSVSSAAQAPGSPNPGANT